MTNEVINETEDSSNGETSVVEQTNAENSVETPETLETVETTEEISVLQDVPETAAATESPSSNDEDFGSILEKFEQEQTTYHSGDLVEGKIVGISDRGVLVDFGYKSEGIIPIEEFTSPTGEVTVQKGDDIEVIIRSIHAGDAPPILSREDVVSRKAWDEIEKSFNDETPVIGRVIDKTKGGLRVDLNGIEAFLPGSQVDSRPIYNLDSFKDQEIEAKVIKFSRKRNNIVLSRKVLTDEIVNKQKAETLGKIEEGFVIDGTIKNLTEYGAFVDIGGIDGLLHVTDMSWGRLQNPGAQFKVGDNIQVKVLKLDREKDKVSLGFKQLIPDPWSSVTEVYPVDSKVKGIVSSVTDYGAFIELEPGVEGLVHVSEMSWSKRSKSPKKLLRTDDEIEVQVLGIDTDDRRISLGMKQLQENPWETINQRYRVGATVHGRVRNLTDFGAFVEIEEGVDGLVHVSDISWSKKIKHPKEVLRKDQEVEAVITSIDMQGHRMSLSIKELTPSAWDSFVSSHKTGDVVRGTISRFAGFGVFVQLGDELEGLCHISELSDERVNKPEDVVSIGQEMDFKILRIENDVQKIGLSARAVGKEEEPVVDAKMYSTEAKGGMASLGELMNLKLGKATDEETAAEEPKLNKKERKAQKAKDKAEEEIGLDSQTDDDSGEAANFQTDAIADEALTTDEAQPTADFAEETAVSETSDADSSKVSNETTENAETDDTAKSDSQNTQETLSETQDTSSEISEDVSALNTSETGETQAANTQNDESVVSNSSETVDLAAEETAVQNDSPNTEEKSAQG